MRLSKSVENKWLVNSGGNVYVVKSIVEYLGKIEMLKNGWNVWWDLMKS